MGCTPQEVNELSMWQYFAALDGFHEANNPDASKEMSAAEVEDVWAWMQTKH